MWVWYTSMSSGDKTLVTCDNMWAVFSILYCDTKLLAYIESQVAIAKHILGNLTQTTGNCIAPVLKKRRWIYVHTYVVMKD